MVGCYSGSVGYMALGRPTFEDAFSSTKPTAPPKFTAWSDIFQGKPTYYAFGLKGPDRSDPIFGVYLNKVLELSDEVNRAAEEAVKSFENEKTEISEAGDGCEGVPPLKKADLSSVPSDPLASLIEKFEFIAPRNPTICVQIGDKTIFSDQSGTMLIDGLREDPRCKTYFRQMWCSDEIRALSEKYRCYQDPTKHGCASTTFDSPPPETATNEVRLFYNHLQSSVHCDKVFQKLKMKPLPVPFHVLSLIKFRSVLQGYMNQLKNDPDSKDLYQTLESAGVRKMSRRKLVEYLNANIEKNPIFNSVYYTLVTFGQAQEKWFD